MTTKPKTINIHGKEYIEVAERVRIVHEEQTGQVSIVTEIIAHDPVLVKATVKIGDQIFMGHSAADPNKSIEKQNPYEVAETSAVGRALGFAGYGLVAGIATADEINKGGYSTSNKATPKQIETIKDQLDRTGVSAIKVCAAYSAQSLNDLTKEQASDTLKKLFDKPDKEVQS